MAHLLPALDDMSATHSSVVPPILSGWLQKVGESSSPFPLCA
jgi:hypothetical protein